MISDPEHLFLNHKPLAASEQAVLVQEASTSIKSLVSCVEVGVHFYLCSTHKQQYSEKSVYISINTLISSHLDLGYKNHSWTANSASAEGKIVPSW